MAFRAQRVKRDAKKTTCLKSEAIFAFVDGEYIGYVYPGGRTSETDHRKAITRAAVIPNRVPQTPDFAAAERRSLLEALNATGHVASAWRESLKMLVFRGMLSSNPNDHVQQCFKLAAVSFSP